MCALLLRSPAKVNLFFRILGRYDNGFHNVATFCHVVDLFDEICLSFSERDAFSVSEKELENEDNLVIKARDVFRKHCAVETNPVSISLKKHIPMQSGLGGGSGNAATTLWGLNQLFGCPFSLKELMTMGASLGADVPLFFSLGAAYCTGRGEKIKRITPLEGQSLKLITPMIGVSTPVVYGKVNLQDVSTIPPEHILSTWLVDGLTPVFVNDLEKPACASSSIFARVWQMIQEEPVKFPMTGSGSAFYSLNAGQEHTFSSPELASMPQFNCQLISRKESEWY